MVRINSCKLKSGNSDVPFQASDQVETPAPTKKTVLDEEPDLEPKQEESVRKIYNILQTLKKHPMAGSFLAPVDPVLVPEYETTTQEQMDLGKVEEKLKNGEYESGYQFAGDVRLIWSNSFFRNAKDSDLYNMTMKLSLLFEELMKGNENLILVEKQANVQDLQRKIENLSKEINEIQIAETKSAKEEEKQSPPPQPDKIMTFEEKKLLCQNITKLNPKFLKGVLEIVNESKDIQGEVFEFDIDKLPPKVCRNLEKYVKECLQSQSESQLRKNQAPIAEAAKNASGSTTNDRKDIRSMLEQLELQKRRENQPEDSESVEEVLPQPGRDIGGNPFMDIEKAPSSVNQFQENIDVDHDSKTGTGLMDFDKTLLK